MPRKKRDKKRPADEVGKESVQSAKGTRRRQRTEADSSRHDPQAYGARSITRGAPGQGLSVTIQIPPLRRAQPAGKNAAKVAPTRRRFLRPILLVPVMILIGLFAIFGPFTKDAKKTPAQPAVAAERTAPDYHPLLPAAEKANASAYDGKRNLVSYTTTFSGARMTVSQQPLPENFANDPAAILRAADSIKATKIVATGRGDLHIATNEIAGDQMGVFADKQVLVFIHCDKQLDDVSWKSFVEQLKAKDWKDAAS
jgi:hypothetical protein